MYTHTCHERCTPRDVPTLHNNHPNKIILEPKVHMLQSLTQVATLCEVKANANIDGYKQTNKQVKRDSKLNHSIVVEPHELTHPITSKTTCGSLSLKHWTKALLGT